MILHGDLNGPQALKALIEGQAIRCKWWTPINRIERVYDEHLEQYIIRARGTDIFVADCTSTGALWLVELLADSATLWEIWTNNLEEAYQASL